MQKNISRIVVATLLSVFSIGAFCAEESKNIDQRRVEFMNDTELSAVNAGRLDSTASSMANSILAALNSTNASSGAKDTIAKAITAAKNQNSMCGEACLAKLVGDAARMAKITISIDTASNAVIVKSNANPVGGGTPVKSQNGILAVNNITKAFKY